jgi:hypothetical protein
MDLHAPVLYAMDCVKNRKIEKAYVYKFRFGITGTVHSQELWPFTDPAHTMCSRIVHGQILWHCTDPEQSLHTNSFGIGCQGQLLILFAYGRR